MPERTTQLAETRQQHRTGPILRAGRGALRNNRNGTNENNAHHKPAAPSDNRANNASSEITNDIPKLIANNNPPPT